MTNIREQIKELRDKTAGAGIHFVLRDRAADTIEKLLAVYEAIDGLLSESNGVEGYHLNGDIASWDELGIPELLNSVQTS